MLKKILSLLLPVILLSAGCSKDPVNVSPTNEYALTNYPNTIAGLQSVLVPAYSAMRDANLYGFEYLTEPMASLTHTADDNGYNTAWTEMLETDISSSNNYALGVWSVCYAGIKNCNTVLEASKVYMANYAQPGDAATVALIDGEGFFFRGVFFFFFVCSLWWA